MVTYFFGFRKNYLPDGGNPGEKLKGVLPELTRCRDSKALNRINKYHAASLPGGKAELECFDKDLRLGILKPKLSRAALAGEIRR